MPKLIIGLVGPLASGKGAISTYLTEKYQADCYRYSSILRDIHDRLYLEQNRPNMQKMSTILRQHFGEDLLAKVIGSDAKNSQNDIVCVDGIRRPSDITHLQNLKEFILVHVDAPIETRLTRLNYRGENSDDQTKTLEEFKKDHQNEADSQLPKVIAMAKETINNSGSLEETHSQINQLINKYLNQATTPNMKIKITRIDKNLPLPEYQSPGAVAFDVYSRENGIINPGEMKMFPANFIIEIPEGYMLMVAPRSSLFKKKGIKMSNTIGIIDQDFNGPEDELHLALHNFSQQPAQIIKGERLAQCMFVRVDKAIHWEETDQISDKSRGMYGSTAGYQETNNNGPLQI